MLMRQSRLSRSPEYERIAREYNAAEIRRVSPKSEGFLLAYLHVCRAADSSLRAFLHEHNLLSTGLHGMGSYLRKLANHRGSIASLTQAEANAFVRNLANPRNRMLHRAGAYPLTKSEVLDLLDEVEACMLAVLRLEN